MPEAASAWRRQGERGNRMALRCMRWLSGRTPGWLANALIFVVSLYFTVFLSRTAKAASNDYLRRVLGRSPRFVDRMRHIRCFSHVVYERVQLLDRGVDGFTIVSRDHKVVADRLEEGRGGILLGAHFGSFEALRAFDRTLPGLRVRYLMFQDNAARTTEVLGAVNPEIAERVIPVSDGQSAMLAVREALDQGDFVAFLGDRIPDPNPRALIDAEFLGDPVDIPRAPYLCAMLGRVPLILCFAPRIGYRTYELFFHEIHGGDTVARGDRDAVCRELAQGYTRRLADYCRRYPYNWFNFFDIWGPGR